MATYCLWKCDSCGYTVETNGPHEFYRDAQGERERYGHPVPRIPGTPHLIHRHVQNRRLDDNLRV